MVEKAENHTVRGPDGNGMRTYLRDLLIVAAGTGARIGSLVALRWSDWDPNAATHGTIRWRGEEQKNGRTRTTPVPESVREALQRHRQQWPGVGEAPIWPALDSDGALRVDVAVDWIQDVEKAARGNHIKGVGWHAL